MTPTTWAVLMVAVAWCFGGGLAFRVGRLRRMGRWYQREELPALVRNLPLQLIPLGCFLGLIGVAAALGPTDEESPSALGMSCFLASFVALGWWLWTMVRPARFLKPEWIRRVDRESVEQSEVTQR